MDFGFTNNEKRFKEIQAFKENAIKDGWDMSPTYYHEDVSHAATLSKNNFRMFVITRENVSGKWKYQAEINIWGPDGLAIYLSSTTYNPKEIHDGVYHCHFCGSTGVMVERVGFANRACELCLPNARKQIEFPGWCD